MKLIILDRDGTLNVDRDDFVKTPEEWQPLPGALEAVARLNHAGWRVVIASNQSGLGRGLFDMAALNAIHAKMHKALAAVGGRIEAVFYCPHSPEESCFCRKPLPGLFEKIGSRFGVPLKGVPTVGDSLRDLQAGSAVGCEPHRVLTGKSAGQQPGMPGVIPADGSGNSNSNNAAADAAFAAESSLWPAGTTTHADLAAFAEWMLRPVAGNP